MGEIASPTGGTKATRGQRGLLPILGVVSLSVAALWSSFQQLSPISSAYKTSHQIGGIANMVFEATPSTTSSVNRRDATTEARTREGPSEDATDLAAFLRNDAANGARDDADVKDGNEPDRIQRYKDNSTRIRADKVTARDEARDVSATGANDATTESQLANQTASNASSSTIGTQNKTGSKGVIDTHHANNQATKATTMDVIPMGKAEDTANTTRAAKAPSSTQASKGTTPHVTFWTRVPLTSVNQSKFYVTLKYDRLLYRLIQADFRVCDNLDHCPTNKTAYATNSQAHPLFHNETVIKIFFERIDKTSKIYRKPEPTSFLAVTYDNESLSQHVPFIVKKETLDKATSRLLVQMCDGPACPKDCTYKQVETNSSFPYYWDLEDQLCRSMTPFFYKKYSDFACGCKSVCHTPEAVEDTERARIWPWQNKSERSLYIDDDPQTRQKIGNMIKVGKAIRTLKQDSSEYKPRFDCQNSTTKIPMPLWAGFESHLFFFPRHKLIFCGIPKSGITEWISFLRYVNGAKDYLGWPHFKTDREEFMLSSLTPEKASGLLFDPTWTKATIFRDPAERLLSAYLDKVVNEGYTQTAFKMGAGSDANNKTTLSFEEFVNIATLPTNFVNGSLENIPLGHGLHAKTDPHWRPQSMMCGLDFLLPHFDFVGNLNFVSQHTKLLLKQVGLWDDYGASFDDGIGDYKVGHKCTKRPKAPGEDGYNVSRVVPGFNQRHITGQHATNSKKKFANYYTPGLMERVRKAYALDFAIFDDIQSRAEEQVDNIASGRDLQVVQSHCKMQDLVLETR